MREYKNNIEPVLLDYMLCNEELERQLEEWGKKRDSIWALTKLCYELKKRIDDSAGVIIPVVSDTMVPGSDNVIFITGEEDCEIVPAIIEDDKKYLMVFTSKEKFDKSVGEYCGIVMFLDTVLNTFSKREDFAGIIFNPDSENVVFDQYYLKGILYGIYGNK